MGNVSTSVVGRHRGRQSRVERSHALPSSLIDRSPATVMRPNYVRDGSFCGRVWVRLRVYICWRLSLTLSSLLCPLFHLLTVSHPRRCSGMGQRPWATPEQLDYLKSFVHLLPQAKETTTLKTLHAQVYDGFLTKWVPQPIIPEAGASVSSEELEVRAKKRLRPVNVVSNPLYSCPTHILPSALPTGTVKPGRRQSNWPPHTLNQHLVCSTYPESLIAGNLPTNATRHSPFVIGNQMTPPLRGEVEDLWAR